MHATVSMNVGSLPVPTDQWRVHYQVHHRKTGWNDASGQGLAGCLLVRKSVTGEGSLQHLFTRTQPTTMVCSDPDEFSMVTEEERIMSRLVEPVPSGQRLAKTEPSPGSYAERITKYIPGEILAGYIAINGILASVTDDQNGLRTWVYLGTFLLCLVLTPIYFTMMAGRDRPKRLQMILSTVAFLVWAYNLGGVFAVLRLYVPWLGSVLLVVFSLISGTLAPRPGEK